MIRFNFYIEKNENLLKYYLKKNLLSFKLENKDLEKMEILCENLSKKDFKISKKYKYKKILQNL